MVILKRYFSQARFCIDKVVTFGIVNSTILLNPTETDKCCGDYVQITEGFLKERRSV